MFIFHKLYLKSVGWVLTQQRNTNESVGCGKSSIYRIKNYMYGGLVA